MGQHSAHYKRTKRESMGADLARGDQSLEPVGPFPCSWEPTQRHRMPSNRLGLRGLHRPSAVGRPGRARGSHLVRAVVQKRLAELPWSFGSSAQYGCGADATMLWRRGCARRKLFFSGGAGHTCDREAGDKDRKEEEKKEKIG